MPDPDVRADHALVFVPPGTRCVQCNRCHSIRLVAGASCFACGNPEYGLVHVGLDGRVESGWPEDAPARPRRAGKGVANG